MRSLFQNMGKILNYTFGIFKTNTKFDIKAIFSFVTFLIVIIKYQIINVHHIIPTHGLPHFFISYLIIVPCVLTSLFLSIVTILMSFRKPIFNLFNIALVCPLLLLMIYYFYFFN